MKWLVGMLLMTLVASTQAAITIDSNGIRVDTDDRRQVEDWKRKHHEDCSSLNLGGMKIQSDGCQNSEARDKENRSIHGDNNPGRGHDKKKHNNKHYDNDD